MAARALQHLIVIGAWPVAVVACAGHVPSQTEADADGDGFADRVDPCPFAAERSSYDWRTLDGCPDDDGDGDGVTTALDRCPLTPVPHGQTSRAGAPGCPMDHDFCGLSRGPSDDPALFAGCPDEDGDGYHDYADLCRGTLAATAVDAQGCSVAQRSAIDARLAEAERNRQAEATERRDAPAGCAHPPCGAGVEAAPSRAAWEGDASVAGLSKLELCVGRVALFWREHPTLKASVLPWSVTFSSDPPSLVVDVRAYLPHEQQDVRDRWSRACVPQAPGTDRGFGRFADTSYGCPGSHPDVKNIVLPWTTPDCMVVTTVDLAPGASPETSIGPASELLSSFALRRRAP